MINSATTVLLQCATVLIVPGTREVRKKGKKKKKERKNATCIQRKTLNQNGLIIEEP